MYDEWLELVQNSYRIVSARDALRFAENINKFVNNEFLGLGTC